MSDPHSYELTQIPGGVPIKSWTRGVAFEEEARKQVENVARLPFVHRHVAVMPDVHYGIGATVGSVVPMTGAIVPAAVGVDIGCGMMAVRTTLTSHQLPESLRAVRSAIEVAVPHGLSKNHRGRDKGSWGNPADDVREEWYKLSPRFEKICAKHGRIKNTNNLVHLGTLGTGNHFIELCLDTQDRLWVMLHSGSRGVGNAIGTHFIELARKDMERQDVQLPHRDLAYFREGSEHFDEYVEAVSWAQDFAMTNRRLMMKHVIETLRKSGLPEFQLTDEAVNCHHNYVAREHHYGKDVLVTRKGAVRAHAGDLGIIPGSMGARSYIVRGKGNPESFMSCSHGAGRAMSRTAARKRFTVADHEAATAGVECRKDEGVIDETPAAYKPIDAVMEAQKDLVDIVHELRQIVCVKG